MTTTPDGNEEPERRKVDLLQLSAFWRYSIALSIVAIVIVVFLVTRPEPSTGGIVAAVVMWVGVLVILAGVPAITGSKRP